MAVSKTKKKEKSYSLSIFLLNRTFSDKSFLNNADEYFDVRASKIPQNYKFYLKKSKYNKPWWFEYCGVSEQESVSQSAVVYCPVKRKNKDYAFLLAFGMAYHDIKEDVLDKKFGMIVAKNVIDPKRISSVDAVSLVNQMKSRIQPAESESLGFIGLDYDSSQLKNMVGFPEKNFENMMSHISGAKNIRVTNRFTADKLDSLLEKIIDIYESDGAKGKFPELENIVHIEDEKLIATLDENLIGKKSFLDEDAFLNWPDIVDTTKDYTYQYVLEKRKSSEFDKVSKEDFSLFLNEAHLSMEKGFLEKVKVVQIEHSEENIRKAINLKNCLSFCCNLKNEKYGLHDGSWYCFDKNFEKTLNVFLESYLVDKPEYLSDFVHEAAPKDKKDIKDKYWVEDKYNREQENFASKIYLLDKNNAQNGKSKVEFCDLLYWGNTNRIQLIHNKLGTHSATLSHLFNQGAVAAESLVRYAEFKKQLKEKLDEKLLNESNCKKNKLTKKERELIDKDRFEIIYCVITQKVNYSDSKNKKINYLPLFSKIALRNAIRRLNAINIKANVCFIKESIV